MEESVVGLRQLLGSLLLGGFVLLAVALEVLSGQGAASPVGQRVADLAPLGWPAPGRVLWWLAVAAAAFGHRRLLQPDRWRLAAVLALPFALFAIGIAAGSARTTWH